MNFSEILYQRYLGRQSYIPVWEAMKYFTDQRNAETPDEIWWVEHDPVFTQGQAGKAHHLLATGDIPVVEADRGGQVTYHGPGQQVCYLLLDIKRKKLGVRALVTAIEQSIVDLAAQYGIQSSPRADAPGVYVDEAKLCSLGLRIRQGRSFHGLALNVNMDMTPFQRINPCGLVGMQMTQLHDLGGASDLETVQKDLLPCLMQNLGYEQLMECAQRQQFALAQFTHLECLSNRSPTESKE